MHDAWTASPRTKMTIRSCRSRITLACIFKNYRPTHIYIHILISGRLLIITMQVCDIQFCVMGVEAGMLCRCRWEENSENYCRRWCSILQVRRHRRRRQWKQLEQCSPTKPSPTRQQWALLVAPPWPSRWGWWGWAPVPGRSQQPSPSTIRRD